MSNLINLLNLDPQELVSFFATLGEKPFRATQVLKWIYQQGVTDFDAMTNLSKALRQQLKTIACVSLPHIALTQSSQDGTRKWLLQLDAENYIEMVLIPEEERHTLCISSQVGCALDCRFCCTAQQGFNRNLQVSEIIAQLWLAESALKAERDEASTGNDEELQPTMTPSGHLITNVVIMGMGEPLVNLDNVIKALYLMKDDNSYGLSWRRLTLSTVGIVPGLLRLKEECPVNLAISLHAPTDTLRSELIPINQKYPLSELLAACRAYIAGDARRKITFEYVMLRGINDSPTQARELVKLLRGLPVKMNLIPFNSFSQSSYQCSSLEVIDQFRNILLQAGIMTMTRKTRGDDINAACGQLAGKVLNRKSLKPVFTHQDR